MLKVDLDGVAQTGNLARHRATQAVAAEIQLAERRETTENARQCNVRELPLPVDVEQSQTGQQRKRRWNDGAGADNVSGHGRDRIG
jgi:hypothetical protein